MYFYSFLQYQIFKINITANEWKIVHLSYSHIGICVKFAFEIVIKGKILFSFLNST
jgi:hypothetical protein